MQDFFYKNPWVRTFLPLLLLTIASITANTLVVEITKGTTIDWREIPKKESFYILLVATFLVALYQVKLFKFDTLQLKGITAKQYESALRNMVIAEIGNRANKLIREGNLEKLREQTMVCKELFGESE